MIASYKILTVSKYNKEQTARWHNDYNKASEEGKYYRPQLALYLFFDTKGNQRKKGYVLDIKYKEGGNAAYCKATKKEVLEILKKKQEDPKKWVV